MDRLRRGILLSGSNKSILLPIRLASENTLCLDFQPWHSGRCLIQMLNNPN
jgi:hypothetical protein